MNNRQFRKVGYALLNVLVLISMVTSLLGTQGLTRAYAQDDVPTATLEPATAVPTDVPTPTPVPATVTPVPTDVPTISNSISSTPDEFATRQLLPTLTPQDNPTSTIEITPTNLLAPIAQLDNLSEWNLYEDSQFNFTAKYPPDWELDSGKIVDPYTYVWETRFINHSSNVYSSIGISISPVQDPTTTLHDLVYSIVNKNGFNTNDLEQLGAIQTTIINNVSAISVTYPDDTGIDTFFIFDNYVYTLFLNVDQHHIADYSPEVSLQNKVIYEQILESLIIGIPTPTITKLDFIGIQSEPEVANSFSLPGGNPVFGYNGRPVFNRGVKSACFNTTWENLYHAGQDRSGTSGQTVYSVANGQVFYYNSSYSNYPGRVVIVRHILQNGSTIYSMYGHLGTVSVTQGQNIKKGDPIGTMVYQLLNGNDNTHLHWEMRYNGDQGVICNYNFPPGPGYTYPGMPDSFGYTNPSDFVAKNGNGTTTDTTKPDGAITNPGENSTITQGTVSIQAWVSDNVALDHAHFTANYNGAWHQISGDFSNSPNTFNWDMCSASNPGGQVQNGSITIGLDIWDKAGNQANSPRGVRHFTKNYNCPSSDSSSPDGNIDTPSQSSTESGTTVHVSGWVSDNASGLDYARIWAYYNNAWQLISNQSYSGQTNSQNFSFDWDVCAANVPVGNVQLKLVARDKAGNTADPVRSVRTFYKSNNCIVKPAAPSLIGPGDGTIVGRYDSVTASWNPVGTAAKYNIYFNGPKFSTTPWTTGTSQFIGSSFQGGVYTWKVNAENSSGVTGDWSSTRTLYRRYAPPSNLTVSGVTTTQINLSWSASADAPSSGDITGYRIYRDGSLLDSVGSGTTTYSNTGLTCGTGSHSYSVTAYNSSTNNTESTASNSISQAPSACGPSVPTLSNPTNNTTFNRTDSVTLSWAVSSGATSYYAEAWGGVNSSNLMNSGWTSNLTWPLGVQWGGPYQWHVKSKNSAGTISGWSETRAFTIKYGTPTNLTGVMTSASTANLSWSASADAPGNIDGYHIYRDGALVGTTTAGVTTFGDSSLGCSSYSYTTKAFKGALESDSSNTASVTNTLCPPATPTNLSISSPGPHSLTLNWQDNSSNEKGFYIYFWMYGSSGWNFYRYDQVAANVTRYINSGYPNCGSDYYYTW